MLSGFPLVGTPSLLRLVSHLGVSESSKGEASITSSPILIFIVGPDSLPAPLTFANSPKYDASGGTKPVHLTRIVRLSNTRHQSGRASITFPSHPPQKGRHFSGWHLWLIWLHRRQLVNMPHQWKDQGWQAFDGAQSNTAPQKGGEITSEWDCRVRDYSFFSTYIRSLDLFCFKRELKWAFTCY